MQCSCCKTESSETNVLKACGYCRKTFYCNPMCQEVHWKQGHKNECKKLATNTPIESANQWFLGEYLWYISDNEHALHCYHLYLEKKNELTFRLIKHTRVDKESCLQEYSGGWTPVVQDEKCKSDSYDLIFSESSKWKILLKCRLYTKDGTPSISDKEILLKLEYVKSSPLGTYWVTVKPFAAFNEFRITLTGSPYAIQDLMLQKFPSDKTTVTCLVNRIEYDFDFYHSSTVAQRILDGKENCLIGWYAYIQKTEKAGKHELLLAIWLSLYLSWIEVVKPLYDPHQNFSRVKDYLFKKIETILAEGKVNMTLFKQEYLDVKDLPLEIQKHFY